MEDAKRRVSSRQNRTEAPMNSQRLWQHTQDLHGFKPDGVSAPTWRGGHGLPPLTKKLYVISTASHRKSAFPNGVSLGHTGPIPGGAGQYKVNSVVVLCLLYLSGRIPGTQLLETMSVTLCVSAWGK